MNLIKELLVVFRIAAPAHERLQGAVWLLFGKFPGCRVQDEGNKPNPLLRVGITNIPISRSCGPLYPIFRHTEILAQDSTL